MWRTVAALLTGVAIVLAQTPLVSVDVRAAETQKKPKVAPKKKAKAPPRSRPRSRPKNEPTPGPRVLPPPKPLESEAGPSESDAAKLARVRARRQAVEQEILKLRRQAESTLKDLDSIDLNLRLAAHQFDEAELEFKETTRRLDATIRDVQTTRARIDVTRPRVMKSLSALSKLGELSYVRLLFSLDDPADILRGFRYVSRIASADGDQIKTFQASLVQLGALEEQLKNRTAQNLETRRRLNQARSVLSARRSNKEQRLAEIAREQQLQEHLASEYQTREADLLRLLGESAETVIPSPARDALPAAPIPPFQPGLTLRARKGSIPWPVGGTLVRKFGVERDPKFGTRTIQQGIEIDAFPEIEVTAVHAGRVVFADQFVGYGMLVIVDHGNREHTLYGRLGELKVSPGDDVTEGSLLGLLPNTRVTGGGLHFEVRVQGKPEDPEDWLKR